MTYSLLRRGAMPGLGITTLPNTDQDYFYSTIYFHGNELLSRSKVYNYMYINDQTTTQFADYTSCH